MDYPLWAAIAAAPLFLVGNIYLLGRRMSEPEKMIRPVTGGLTPLQQQTLLQYKDWLASVNLEFLSAFQFEKISVVVFQQRNEPRFFSFLFHQKLTYQVESYLEDLTILDTGTSGSLGLFPRPGAFGQSFPGITPQEAWKRHLESEAYLSKKFGYTWKLLNKPYEQLLPEAIRLRMKYNRAQMFWPVRVLYRFFVTRHRIRNKTIAQQFP